MGFELPKKSRTRKKIFSLVVVVAQKSSEVNYCYGTTYCIKDNPKLFSVLVIITRLAAALSKDDFSRRSWWKINVLTDIS